MDEIEKFEELEDMKSEVKAAASKAIEKLKKYYSYTSALPYTISTSMLHFFFVLHWFYFSCFTNFFLVLDPHLKLQYYIDNKWENQFVVAAQNDLNNLYKTNYASPENTIISNEYPEDSLLQHIYKRRRIVNNNEIDQYLAAPVVLYGTDILNWWKVWIYNDFKF